MSTNSGLIIMIFVYTISNFVSAKWTLKMDTSLESSELSIKPSLKHHKLIKRVAVGQKDATKLGIGAVMMVPRTEKPNNTRECLEWKKQPFTGKWKCLQFKWKKFIVRSRGKQSSH